MFCLYNTSNFTCFTFKYFLVRGADRPYRCALHVPRSASYNTHYVYNIVSKNDNANQISVKIIIILCHKLLFCNDFQFFEVDFIISIFRCQTADIEVHIGGKFVFADKNTFVIFAVD